MMLLGNAATSRAVTGHDAERAGDLCAGEAGDEGTAAFTGNRQDLEGKLVNRLAVRGGVGHFSASERPPGCLRRKAMSRSTASRPGLVIFSAPVRMASTAAPRS